MSNTSTAVIISGQARTFGANLRDPAGGHMRVFESQVWQLYSRLPDPYFYVSVADEPDAAQMALLENVFPGRVHMERVTQPTLPERPEYAGAMQAATPYRISAPIQSILRQLWANDRAWQFMLEAQSRNALPAQSLYVRLRPDLFFHRFDMPPRLPRADEALTCYWGSYGGVNDRFALLGRQAAEAWFTAHRQLDKMLSGGCPLHPESLQLAALRLAGCINHPCLVADFTGIRPTGEMVPQVPIASDLPRYQAALFALMGRRD